MKLLKRIGFSSMAAAFAGIGWGQTQVDLRTQTKSVDFSAATSTLPSKTGPVLPLSCQLGATFILTSTLAGQNWYICTAANQWSLQSGALPAIGGNAGGVLSTNGGSIFWSQLGGDISGAPASASVNKLLGRPLNSSAPSAGQFLGWDGAQWTAQAVSSAGAVSSIFGRIGTVTAQSGDYSFAQISGVLASGQLPATGGDLSGAIASATVTRLQTRPVASTAPSTGQVLAWSGSQWSPQNATGGVASVFGRVGAVAAQSGDYTAAQVSNAADLTHSNSYAAGARQIVASTINGAGLQIAPGALPSAPLPGDLALDSGDSNRMKVYNGSAWITVNPTTAPVNYSAVFTSATSVSIPGTTHNLGTGNLLVQCFDNQTPSNLVEPSQISIDPSTLNVTIAFATAQSGHCVLNGYSGSSSSGSGGSGGSGGSSGGAGMASQLGDFAVIWSSASLLTIGGNCSSATPCNVRFGTQVDSLTHSASATVSGGSSGTAFIYVDSSGTLTVGSSMSLICTAYCVAAPGITGFPLNSIPIFTWTASNGSWDASGGIDRRGWLSANAIFGGAGIAALTTAGQTTIAVDSAVVPTYLTASATLAFPSIPAGTCAADLTFSLPGANIGNSVTPGWPGGLEAGLSGIMRIASAGVVSVRLCASAGGAVSPAAATFTATVVRGF